MDGLAWPSGDTTASRLEAALVRHYLSTESGSGAAPLTFIDASASSLRESLECEDDASALDALVRGCGGPESVAHVLAYGWQRQWSQPGTPGYFRYLVLTCAVVASADDNLDSRDFGVNLQRLLRTDRTFSLRTSLPTLWTSLAVWCEQARAGGQPIRAVELPTPGVGVYLGLTNAVSFPAWRDLRALRGWRDRHPTAALRIREPIDAARLLCGDVVTGGPFSDQLVQASAEFFQLYLSDAKLLHLHRFWGAFCRALERISPRVANEATSTRIELLPAPVVADTTLKVTTIDRSGAEVPEAASLEGPAEAVADQFVEARRAVVPLDRHAARFLAGAMPFVQERFGVWSATARFPAPDEQWTYLLSTDAVAKTTAIANVRPSRLTDRWFLVGPVSGDRARRMHFALGLSAMQSAKDVDDPLTLEGGMRTRCGWLGRAAFLPTIWRIGVGDVRLRPVAAHAAEPTLAATGNGVQIRSGAPLDGAYRLSLEEGSGSGRPGQRLSVERPVRFVANAPEHFSLPSAPDAWRDQFECRPEAWANAPAQTWSVHACQTFAEEGSSPTDDFLEAVYVRGRSGWGERHLVELVALSLPGPSPWDVLRSLQEAGWLRRTVSLRWKAVTWWLVPPGLLSLGTRVVLTGSCPRVVRDRFVATATAIGARVTGSEGVGSHSVRTLQAFGVDAVDLSSALGWPLSPALVAAPTAAPRCWPADDDPRQHRWSQEWDWRIGAFTSERLEASNSVRLSRWTRPENDRPDVFALDLGSRRVLATASRTVAVAEAHRIAREPMFAATDGCQILRLPRQGNLPMHLARACHLSTARAAGPVRSGDRWTYAYATDDFGQKAIAACMGARFVQGWHAGQLRMDHAPTVASLVSAARRRGTPFRYPVEETE